MALIGNLSLWACLALQGTQPLAPPCITQFQATPGLVEAGQPVLLSWTLAGGAPSHLTLEDDLSGSPPRDLTGRSRWLLGGALRRQTFTLKAANAAGSCQARFTVVSRGLSLLAGAGGPGRADELRGLAAFRLPTALAMDGAGNLIIADSGNATIRQMTPGGRITTLAGQSGQKEAKDGPGLAARFQDPEGLAVDPARGVIYVADCGNQTIRAIAPGGEVSTIAGAPGQAGMADGRGAEARFNDPRGLAVGEDGALYVADSGNNLIRRIALADRVVTTLAGTTGAWGTADGPSASAQFAYPWALAVDGDHTVYVADLFNNSIRKIASGQVTTLAGTGEAGSKDGALQTAEFHYPTALQVRKDGSLLVCDSGDGRIRSVDPSGVATCATGLAEPFKDPMGMALDGSGGFYVADTGHDAIYHLGAGPATRIGCAPASADPGNLSGASKVVLAPAGLEAWVADRGGRLRAVAATGVARLLELRPSLGQEDALKGLGGFTVDGNGTIFAVNQEAASLLAIAPGGWVRTVAAAGESFQRPVDVAVDGAGNLYVTDAGEATVRRVSCEGMVSVFAGSPLQTGTVDGPGDQARFVSPAGIAMDAGGDLYVADPGAHTIRMISPTGYVTTLAGHPGEPGSNDGDAATARFNAPEGVAVDDAGNVFVADTGNGTVRRIGPDGRVTTLAGRPGRPGGVLGPLPGSLSQPRSLAVKPDGDLLVLSADGLIQITAP